MDTSNDQAAAPEQNPTKGGSYLRDPDTGDLDLQHATEPAEPDLASEPKKGE